MTTPLIDRAAMKEAVMQMNEQGYACIPEFISRKHLEELREHVAREASRHHGEYFAHHGNAGLGRQLQALGSDPALRSLLSEVFQHGAGRRAFSDRIYQVLRCVQGSNGRKESNCFHYDATLVTALLPVEIPQEGTQRGDLLLFANSRRLRRSVLFNVVEKALLQNAFSRWLIALGIRHGLLHPQRLQLQPGNLYLFWGYRTLHANEPCDPSLRRATAIFHYGDPHAGSLSTRLILKLNQGRARRRNLQGERQPV